MIRDEGDFKKAINKIIDEDNVAELATYNMYPNSSYLRAMRHGSWKCLEYLCQKKSTAYLCDRAKILIQCIVIPGFMRELEIIFKYTKFTDEEYQVLIYMCRSEQDYFVACGLLDMLHNSTKLPIPVPDELEAGSNLWLHSIELEVAKDIHRRRACTVMFCTDKTLIDSDILPIISKLMYL